MNGVDFKTIRLIIMLESPMAIKDFILTSFARRIPDKEHRPLLDCL
jgi:hypothetical protein